MKHPETENMEADQFILDLSEHCNILKSFDLLMVNQQFSQINILRKVLKDSILDNQTRSDELQQVICDRVALLQKSLHYLYIKSTDKQVQIDNFSNFCKLFASETTPK